MGLKNQPTKAEALDFVDFKRLLKGLRQDELYKWELYCTASFCTALRVSDVKSTSWGDLLHQNDFIKLEKKTSKLRDIKIGQSFQLRLQELYELMGSPSLDSSIIQNNKTGKELSTQYINRYIKNFIFWYKLPIRKFSSHTFRKTFGRYIWEMMGKTTEALVLLCLIFKHANVQTTMIYLGIRQDEIEGLYDMIELD